MKKLALSLCVVWVVAFLAAPQESAAKQPKTKGLAQRVAGLERGIAILAAEVRRLRIVTQRQQTAISALQDELTAVQDNEALALDPYLSVSTPDGLPQVTLTGVNLHVVNGMGDTRTTNGLGNVIVGYNEDRDASFDPLCSDGGEEDEVGCLAEGAVWAVNHKSGSHNVIVGRWHAYSSYSGLVAGTGNAVTNHGATATGGARNVSRGTGGSVTGGISNTVSGGNSAVCGGSNNVASGNTTAVLGGSHNEAAGGGRAVVVGGRGNLSQNAETVAVGGRNNSTFSNFSTVVGGRSNTAFGLYSVVSGGSGRTAPGEDDWAAGSLLEDF